MGRKILCVIGALGAIAADARLRLSSADAQTAERRDFSEDDEGLVSQKIFNVVERPGFDAGLIKTIFENGQLEEQLTSAARTWWDNLDSHTRSKVLENFC